MTIIEVINSVDELKPNAYTQVEKVEWLSVLDGMIKRTVIDNYEDFEEFPFEPYNEDTPLSTQLLVAAPYDEMYLYWLESKIDYTNGEYSKYNNSITRFNDTFNEYKKDYNRTHIPKGVKFKYF